ncbi:Mu transposase C-terminal domain-containing protein [Serratia sp. IR-2025]|uniref:Mu transposase C-terminal domain-containing protein n=1 Tax=Serratia marcescens TaxID=615 RepID=UPI00313BBB58
MKANEILMRKVMKGKLHVYGSVYFSKELENVSGKVVLVSFDTSAPDNLTVQLTDGSYVCTANRVEMINRSPYRPSKGSALNR